jgi:hypothetical protein
MEHLNAYGKLNIRHGAMKEVLEESDPRKPTTQYFIHKKRESPKLQNYEQSP